MLWIREVFGRIFLLPPQFVVDKIGESPKKHWTQTDREDTRRGHKPHHEPCRDRANLGIGISLRHHHPAGRALRDRNPWTN